MGGFGGFFQGQGAYWAWRNFAEIRGEVDGYLRVGGVRHLYRISRLVAPSVLLDSSLGVSRDPEWRAR